MDNKSFDIDKEGDDIIISIKIYNPQKYDIINKRLIKTEAVIELIFQNQSNELIEIGNPEIIIYERGSFSTKISRYNSSELENEFPKGIDSKGILKILYNSKQLENLLEESIEEILMFQVTDSNRNIYTSLELSGDNIEAVIENVNNLAFWESKKTYEFDHIIE